MTDYDRWNRWAEALDEDGDPLNVNMKIPLDDVSDDYLRRLDLSDVTAECGAPMNQEQFDAYMAKRGGRDVPVISANTVVKK